MIIERVYIPSIDFTNAMNAVADPECTRDTMASFYEDLLRCSFANGTDCIDWKTVNKAILERWPRGLNYIKTKAWKLAQRKQGS